MAEWLDAKGKLQGQGDRMNDWMFEPNGKWYAKPCEMSEGTKDWRVVYHHSEEGKITFALCAPTKAKAEALAKRLNKVVAWMEVREPIII